MCFRPLLFFVLPETTPHRPTVGAVIVHFHAPDHLRASIRSLQLGTLVPARILVVDNSETDAARGAGRAVAEQLGVEHVASPHNIGFGAACNAGAASLDDADHLFFLNQDAEVQRDTVHRLSSLLNADQRLAAINPRIERPDQRLWFASGTFNATLARLTIPGQGDRSARAFGGQLTSCTTQWVNGCALLVRSEAWKEVGGFDERFFMYWEDVDLSLRLVDRDWRLGVDLEALAVHDQGASDITKITPTVIEHSIRSRAQFIELRLRGAQRWTARAYTAVNALRFAAGAIRIHGFDSRDYLRAVIAGLRPRSTDGNQ